MSYRLNKTNGDLLIDLVDGQIDTTTTNLTLVGRNYKGFGEFLNENFIKLLENFSGSAAPGIPITGQLWWDTSEQRLKLYNGTTFKAAGGPIVSSQQPTGLVAGDLWIDNDNNQLYFHDGTDLVLVGPEFKAGQQKTGFEVQSVITTVNVTKTALKLYIGGTLVGVFADSQYYADVVNGVPGYPEDPLDTQTPKRQLFKQGFNPVTSAFIYNGTATFSKGLVDDSGNEFTDANFMRTDQATSTSGKLSIKNTNGLAIGIGDNEYGLLKTNPSTQEVELETQQQNTDINLKVRVGNTFVSGLYVDATNERVGVFNNAPTVKLAVAGAGKFTGDLTVTGNLLVQGDTTYLNVSTLRVEDKNIELGILDDSTISNDAAVDGAGLTIRSSGGDKELFWIDATDSWTSNQDFNLITHALNPTPEYKIDGALLLSQTTLSSTVTSATGLTQVGTLTALAVDDVTIDGSTITTTASPLQIVSQGTITVNSKKIAGVTDPTSAQDVATKNYVDAQIDADNIGLSLDITGFNNPFVPGTNVGPTVDVQGVLNVVYPSSTKNGATAIIHCWHPSGPARYTMTFTSDGSSWTHANTSNYP